MSENVTSHKSYCLAAALGALGGGLAVAMATGALPKVAGNIKKRMAEACTDHCPCAQETAEKDGEEAAVGSYN